MTFANLPEYLAVLGAYCTIFIAIPFWLRGYKFRHPNAIDKMVSTLLFSNLTVIMAVYFLTILGIYYRITLILLLLLICFFYRYFKSPDKRWKSLSRFFFHLKNLADSVELSSVMFRNLLFSVRQGIAMIIRKIRNPIALIILIGIFGFYMYITGYHSLENMFFGTSDMYLHTEWIKYMQVNSPFAGGVYPMGIHAVMMVITDVFGFNIVTVMRMFGTIVAFLMMYSIFYLLQNTMRSSFAICFSLGIYGVSALFPYYATERSFLALPQEYAAVFLYLAAYHFWMYLKTAKESKGETAPLFFESHQVVDIGRLKKMKPYKMPYDSPNWYLVHFLVSVALTASIHPFMTGFAALICLMIFITHFKYINRQVFLRLASAVGIGVALAIVPLAIGLLKGIPLNNSFLWAASVVADQSSADPMQGNLFVRLQSLELFDKGHGLDPQWFIPYLTFCFLGIISAFFRYQNRERSEIFAAFSCYSLLLCLLYALAVTDIFKVLETSRLYAYFNYSLPLIFAITPDLLHALFDGAKANRSKWKGVYYGLVAVIAISLSFVLYNQYGFRTLQRVVKMQQNGAVTAYYQIKKEYPKNTWLIISSFVEYPQTLNEGYHYEMSEFIFELNDITDEPLHIDAENIFLFITKRANDYRYIVFLGEEDELKPLDPKLAEIDFQRAAFGHDKISIYYDVDLNNLMQAKALAWAQEYQTYFPDEMELYYEDEDVIVYRFKQNIYELNDFRMTTANR